MPADFDIPKAFIRATTEVLTTMASLQAQPGTPFVKRHPAAMGEISAVVGVTGIQRGTISVTFTRPCAAALATGMLGNDIHNMENDMEDAVGEVVNIISGRARAILAEGGLILQGSTPTIITGLNHVIRHMNASLAIAIPFTTDNGAFTVEFCLE